MKLDILAFGAHPDDVELGAGGLLAKEAAEGKKTGIIDLTRGEMGTRGTPEIRDLEAQEAAYFGSSIRINLQMADGFFANNAAHQESVARSLRIPTRYCDRQCTGRPTPRPWEGIAVVRDACFLSGLWKWKIQDEKAKNWQPKVLYYYIQFRELKPDLIVDISGYHRQKMERCEGAQKPVLRPEQQGTGNIIASKEFFESVTYRARNYGRIIGVPYGEGYIVDRTLGSPNSQLSDLSSD